MNVLPTTPFFRAAFPVLYVGIVEISTCQGINDSRLSVVCEAFLNVALPGGGNDAKAVCQP